VTKLETQDATTKSPLNRSFRLYVSLQWRTVIVHETNWLDSGGSILTEFLLSFSHEIDLSAVVRSDDHIKAIGNLPNGSLVKVIKFSGLDDTEQLKQLASEYDGMFDESQKVLEVRFL